MALSNSSWLEAMQEELLQFKLQQVWILVDLPNEKKAIRTKWVFKNKKDERVIVIRNKASAFLYGTIKEEVYVTHPLGFKDHDHLKKVYKVVKALYGLHQAQRAWYETLANYLLSNGFKRGKIDQTLFIKKQKGYILLVQVYVDDIIFGSTNKELCTGFEKLMKDKFQMSFMGELTFFLGLQVQQKEDGIFISQDKYVAEILKKFNYSDVKSASTPVDLEKPLSKKQTVVATSITEDEYVAAASCCGQVGDEAVHKELVVKMENSFTTASSLEAEHDSGLSFPSKQSTRIHLYQEVPLGSRAGHVMETYWNDGDFCYKTVNGREGTDCLPIATIFEELARMSAWNEISSSMASLILMLQIRSFHLSKFLIYNKAKDASSIRRLCFEKRIQRSGRSLGRSLGAPEDASKQGRSIADIDADVEDDEMSVEATFHEKREQSTKPDDSTTGKAVTTASVEDSVVPTTIKEIILAQTLIQIKAAKPKVVTTAATTITTTRPKTRGTIGWDSHFKQLTGIKALDEFKVVDKEMKRVNTFVAMDSTVQESKKEGFIKWLRGYIGTLSVDKSRWKFQKIFFNDKDATRNRQRRLGSTLEDSKGKLFPEYVMKDFKEKLKIQKMNISLGEDVGT
ncbi:putative ribonuclease H-like domain-containing protein [Tanacetum coccineum]